ncbi:MAG: twin-arginine translocase subunit TatC [Planctomyces sp.]|jgi:sec-independent protein translocase protein TatC|nr:twin-arginine translocase subunit TatC [Planctomyces sp.]
MPRNHDLFDDTTMTFGEHLEVLRIHVFRAVVGLLLAVAVSLFFGDRIFYWLRQPVEKALRERGIDNVAMDVPKQSFYQYLTGMFSGTTKAGNTNQPTPAQPQPPALKSDQLLVRIDRAELLKALGQNPAPPPASPAPSAEYVNVVITAPEFAQLQRVIEDTSRITTFKVEEGFMAYMKVCFFSGLILAAPWVFYQLWLFVAAGLYPHERRYVYVYLPLSVILFALGAMAGYFYAFPLMLDFLIGFNQWLGVTVQPRLSEYISMAMLMPLLFGISFQLPLVMVFLERIGVCTVQTYRENWRIAVLAISIASMLLTASPDPWSMLLMMFPLLLLYVLGIWLCQFRIGGPASPIR